MFRSAVKRTMASLLVVVGFIAWDYLTQAFAEGPSLAPPLERNNYARITSSAEISVFLDELDQNSPLAKKELLGHSVAGIRCQVVRNASTKTVLAQHLAPANPRNENEKKMRLPDLAVLSERHIALSCKPGDLWIDVAQPFGKLAVILLEPLSSSSLFRAPPYSETLEPGKEFFICRVDGKRIMHSE